MQPLGHPGREHPQFGADLNAPTLATTAPTAATTASSISSASNWAGRGSAPWVARRPLRLKVRAGPPQIEMLDPEGVGEACYDALIAIRLVVARGNRYLTSVIHGYRDEPRQSPQRGDDASATAQIGRVLGREGQQDVEPVPLQGICQALAPRCPLVPDRFHSLSRCDHRSSAVLMRHPSIVHYMDQEVKNTPERWPRSTHRLLWFSPHRSQLALRSVHARQRLVQILDEIGHVFDSGRETDQTVTDAGRHRSSADSVRWVESSG